MRLLIIAQLLSLNAFAFQQSVTVNLSNANNKLDLSEVVETVDAIPIETHKEGRFTSINEVLVTDEHLYLNALYKQETKTVYKLLRFNKDGTFNKQIGETSEVRFNIFYDPKQATLSVTNSKSITTFNLDGEQIFSRKFEVNNGETFQWIIYSSSLYETRMKFTDKRFSYSFNKYESLESAKKTKIKEITDPSQEPFPVGFFPYRTINDNQFYISFNVDNIIYRLNDGHLKKHIEFKFNSPLKKKPLLGEGILGSWAFSTCKFPSRATMMVFYNLKSKEQYIIPFKYSKYKTESGIADDIFQSGFLTPRLAIWNGQTDRKTQLFYWQKNPSEVPELQNSKATKVLFIAYPN